MQRTKATSTQLNFLVDFMKENSVCAAGRANSLQGKVELEKQWKQLVSTLNSLRGPIKTEEKWKQTWRDLRNSVTKKAIQNKKEFKGDGPGGTGNGQSQLEAFTAQDEAVMSTNGPVAIFELDDILCTTEDTTPSSNLQDQTPSTSYAVPKTKNKNLKRKLDDDLMQLAANRLREKPDEYQNWALACAADLKKMEPIQQCFTKNVISAIIMEGQLGLFHPNSVKINTPTVTITPSPTYTRSTPTPTNYSSTPSPRYSINYSQQQNSELPPEQLPHNQQNMYCFQQDNQQNMNNFQQENDADDSMADEGSLSQYIQFNK